ncbi:unnamed protein product [Cylicocyclus nassatus]|uniref:Potassium channel domain-containing protein n=1 Tax=Cylicocyclus nassatus TaxID=53992 RepID=A0AA36HE79_CYLNA|nr:unnamed protein product [Cylicocyclus nassatus]
MGRETIGDFFYHSEVPKLDVLDLRDTTKYKYTAEPTIKRAESFSSLSTPRKEPGYKWNMYYILWRINEFIELRHLFMIFMITAYTALGAYLLYTIESKNEKAIYPTRMKDLTAAVVDLAKKYKEEKKSNRSVLLEELKGDYKKLQSFENIYKWSTYYRIEEQYKWNAWSATFFAMNLYTTVGYGTIAAETLTGIACVMIYTMLFCPITMVISRDLGQCGLVYLTKFYGYIKYRFTSTAEKAAILADDLVILPVKYGWVAMFGFLGLTTVFLYFYDGLTGPDAGLSWWECFYFSVQTYTTAGFGDIMPINVTFDPIVGLVYFFCLPVLKVVNRMTYLYLENGIHGYFAIVDSTINSYLNTLHSSEKPKALTDLATSTSEDYYNKELEWANGLTIRSLAAMASSPADVFGGALGRIDLRAEDLQPVRKGSKN